MPAQTVDYAILFHIFFAAIAFHVIQFFMHACTHCFVS